MDQEEEREEGKRYTLVDARQYLLNQFADTIESIPDEYLAQLPQDKLDRLLSLVSLTKSKWQQQMHAYRASLQLKRQRRKDKPVADIREAYRMIEGTNLKFYVKGSEYYIYRDTHFLSRTSTTTRLLQVLRRLKKSISNQVRKKKEEAVEKDLLT